MTGKKIQVTLKPKILEMLEAYAEERGIAKSAVVALAIEKYVREGVNREGK